MKPGDVSSHPDREEEICLVVAGRPTLLTVAEERELRPWDVAWLDGGEAGAHQLRNDGGESARVVFFSTVAQKP